MFLIILRNQELVFLNVSTEFPSGRKMAGAKCQHNLVKFSFCLCLL